MSCNLVTVWFPCFIHCWNSWEPGLCHCFNFSPCLYSWTQANQTFLTAWSFSPKVTSKSQVSDLFSVLFLLMHLEHLTSLVSPSFKVCLTWFLWHEMIVVFFSLSDHAIIFLASLPLPVLLVSSLPRIVLTSLTSRRHLVGDVSLLHYYICVS